MALKVKVKKTVTLDIDIDQKGLEKLVRDHIAAEDPNIIVNHVKFVATRKPAGVAVEVEAEYADDDDEVKADVCKGCGEAVCECAEESGEAEKEEDAPDPEPAEEQLELEETTEPEATSEESFEDSEMDLIDETLAEHADDEDAPAMDLPDVDTDLPDGMDDLPDVDAEPTPKRKSLFAKD